MKRLFASLAFVLAILLTACQQEVLELEQITESTSDLVTINVDVDEQSMTRSGDEKAPNRYIMEVYTIDENMVGEPIPSDQKPDAVLYGPEGRFNTEFKEGQNYRLLFWADCLTRPLEEGEDLYDDGFSGYAHRDLKYVFLSDKIREAAFSGSVSFCYEAAAAVKPYMNNTLTHAVCQVIFVQTKAITTPENSLEVRLSTMQSSHCQCFNVDGAVVSLGYHCLDVAKVDFGAIDANTVLSTNYVFGDSEHSSITDIEYRYNDGEGKIISNVPLQRNYRTFIRGDFSSNAGVGGTTIEVTIDDSWNEGETPMP